MATYMDPKEKEGRRKDGSITFVKIVWSMDIGIPIQEASHIATDRDFWRNTVRKMGCQSARTLSSTSRL